MPEVQRILDAIFAISSDLEWPAVLQRIVQVACDQTGAQYGAVGVLGAASAEGEILLTEFVTEGINDDLVRRIGHLPRGLGSLSRCDSTTSARMRTRSGFPPDTRRCTRSSASRSAFATRSSATST